MEKITMDALNRLPVDAFRNAGKLPLILVLDNIRSGLNIGSVFRTADAFALEKIILCGISVQPPHREVLKTALGSTDSVDWIHYSETTEAIRFLIDTGYRVFAIEQTNPKTWLHNFQPEPESKYAFVLGNEVDGVQESALALCEGALEIPQFGTKHSLNVAVAAGVVAWDFVTKSNQIKSL